MDRIFHRHSRSDPSNLSSGTLQAPAHTVVEPGRNALSVTTAENIRNVIAVSGVTTDVAVVMYNFDNGVAGLLHLLAGNDAAVAADMSRLLSTVRVNGAITGKVDISLLSGDSSALMQMAHEIAKSFGAGEVHVDAGSGKSYDIAISALDGKIYDLPQSKTREKTRLDFDMELRESLQLTYRGGELGMSRLRFVSPLDTSDYEWLRSPVHIGKYSISVNGHGGVDFSYKLVPAQDATETAYELEGYLKEKLAPKVQHADVIKVNVIGEDNSKYLVISLEGVGSAVFERISAALREAIEEGCVRYGV